MSLQKIFITGIRWTGFSALLSLILGLLQVVLLAQFLEKSDFAWVAIAGVFVNIGIPLQQSILNTAIVQATELTQKQLSTAFWLNIGIGIGLFLISIIVAFVLLWLYSSETLQLLFILYSFIFIIQAFAGQYKAILQKNFSFQILSLGESVSVIGSFIVSLLSAINGWGAYALVSGYITRNVIEAIWVIILGRYYFIPTLEWSWKAVQPLARFGIWHFSERLITLLGAQLDILIIGRFLGSDALGTYDVFKRILVRPLHILNEILEKVTYPVFSEFQSDQNFHKKLYLSLLACLGSINFPLLAFFALAAKPIIQFLFGTSWLDDVLIFQLLCLFCIFQFLLNPIDTLLLASGKIRLWLLANLIFIPIQIIFITISSQFNLTIVTITNVIIHLFFTMAAYFFLVLPRIHSNISAIVESLKRPFFITSLASFFLLPLVLFTSDVFFFILFGVLFYLIYLLLTFLYNRDFINLLQSFLKIKL